MQAFNFNKTQSLKYYILFIQLFISFSGTTQNMYWQQQVNFKIDVKLNDKEHSLDAFEKIEYINHSPDTLTFIWFHLWPNAYRTDKTAFSDQLLENGRTDFYFSNKEDRGYINRLDFRVNSILAKTEDHPQHIDIIKVLLPQPLLPGATVEITTPFHVQLPKNFSRGGHAGQAYQATQWYPKPAVYDQHGWHPMPYLDQGEFYNDFGNYEVKITVPANYVVASSGKLQNEDFSKTDTVVPKIKKEIKIKTSSTTIKTKKEVFPKSSLDTKTLIYKQSGIHDFAWFADKRFILKHDTLQLPSGTIIDIYAYHFSKNEKVWGKSLQMIKDAVLFRSKSIAEYPYNIISVVEAQMGFKGGMEYPCITAITPMKTAKDLENIIEHEVGHNWFQGMLANNERKYAWLDEGINTYYDNRFDKEISRYQPKPKTKKSIHLNIDDNLFLKSYERWKIDMPLNTASDSMTETNYYLTTYTKGAEFMQLLEKKLGRPEFDIAMQAYFNQWKLKHPYPLDLKNSLETSTGKDLGAAFSLLNQKGPLSKDPKRKLKFVPFIGTNDSSTNVIMATPILGINLYDGLMIGAAFTNYTLPDTKFQFLLAPMYATKSKLFNGAGRISYTFYPNNIFKRIITSVSGLKFNTDDFTDTANNKFITGFRKLSTSLKFVLRESNPRSSRERFFQWRTFYFNEDNLRFKSDTFPNGNRFLTITKYKTDRYLNQLRFVIADSRILYPYKAEIMAEQAADFIRLALTGNYYLNYNENLGLDVRFFAGKFIYLGENTSSKQFDTDPYHLNLSGPKGYEDYTYSNYFIGRSEFEGAASQQIMMRDGGFKVRTDLLADKIGKTDDWLMAMNFVTDIPDQINILKLLPVKIPLRIYADIGTYAEAWKADATGNKILFNAGLQFSFLKNTINVYMPLFYSKVYKDYFQTTISDKIFKKNISFSIDIQNFSLKKIDRRFPF